MNTVQQRKLNPTATDLQNEGSSSSLSSLPDRTRTNSYFAHKTEQTMQRYRGERYRQSYTDRRQGFECKHLDRLRNTGRLAHGGGEIHDEEVGGVL
jgi:hypothetical protein